MSFSVSDFTDLVRLLEEQPGWRAELRRLVLTEEILTLPDLVRSLVEAQQRTEARMEALAEALAALTQRVDHLAAQMEELGRRLDQLTHGVEVLTEVQQKMAEDVGTLKGSDLERKYREKAPAYFSRIIKRAHLLSSDELVELLAEAVDRGHISEKEEDELALADAIIRGRRREDDAQVYLVVEVSWGVGVQDVQRAMERAQALAKAGVEAIPVVAGSWVTVDAQQAAPSMKVWQVCDGRTVPPP